MMLVGGEEVIDHVSDQLNMVDIVQCASKLGLSTEQWNMVDVVQCASNFGFSIEKFYNLNLRRILWS